MLTPIKEIMMHISHVRISVYCYATHTPSAMLFSKL